MHQSSQFSPPTWLGGVVLVFGILVLLLSPKIVALQIAQLRMTNRWLLNLVGYDGEFLLSQKDNDPDNESGLARFQRSSYWFWTIVMGLVLMGFGAAILLKFKGLFVGS